MFNAHVFEVLITSPSDVPKKIIDNIYESIYKWNRIHSKNKNIILKPLRWETDVYSSMSNNEAQSVIRNQIVKHADVLIGVFWTRIGTPTKTYISGSVEEIEEHIQAQKPTMLFFLEKPIAPELIAQEQYNKLIQIKSQWEKRGLYKKFKESNTNIFHDELCLLFNDSKNKYLSEQLIRNKDELTEGFSLLKFEYDFSDKKDGKRIWYQKSPFLWIEKAPYSPIPEKIFLSYEYSNSINGIDGTIVQCATNDEEIGFQVFIPRSNNKDMRLYWRIVNKPHNDWEPLGVGPIKYI